VSQTVLRRVLEESEPLIVSNASEEPGLAESASVTALQLRSILCHPFDPLEGLRGVLYLDSRLKSGAFDARAQRLLGMLADQATLAVRQVRRVEEIRELNERLHDEVADRNQDLDEARKALEAAGLPAPVPGLVGESPRMLEVFDLIRRAANGPLPVLVTGASGTGKELAARAVHDLGSDREGPFVSENCTAIPATLLEAELFGARKGAFTGADRDRPGMFERAEGGTLFLDEIGELPLEFQAKLLRVLETREVRRVGDDHVRHVSFRLVTATNRDLLAEVDAGNFRSDLYYRLAGLTIAMPTLAERRDDVPRLVEHLLEKESRRQGVVRRCSPEMLRALEERDWPGNVRELSNTVARLCLLSDGDLDDPRLLAEPDRQERSSDPDALLPLAELERRAIERALDRTNGDKQRAADLLGISRSKIYQKLKEYREQDRP
jgi:transcriptional regulator with GAF, ATPase, and Fis domain